MQLQANNLFRINMAQKFFPYFLAIFFILSYVSSCNANLKNAKDSVSISMPLMEALELHQGIIIEEDNKIKSIHDFKKFSFYFIPIMYRNVKELLKYIVKDPPFYVKTAIIFKENTIINAIWILEELEKLDMSHKSTQFSWFFYLESILNTEPYEKLLVRYDCEFIFIYPVNNTTYKLTEIYKIKNSTVIYDYGTWNYEEGLKFVNISLLKRRIDLNNSVLTMEYFSHLHGCYGPGCAQLEIIWDMERLLNFQYKQIFVPERAEKWKCNPTLKDSDLIWMYLPHHGDFYFFQCDVIGPFFSLLLNWYIKYPVNIPQADYYTQPFEYDVWLAMLALIIFGSAMLTFMLFLKTRNMATGGEKFNFNDCLFITFETFCNQYGSETIIFKTVIFALRFSAMFAIASYSAIILSFLTVQIPKIPFRNVEEFSKKNEYLINSLNESGYYPRYFLSLSRNPYAKEISKNLPKMIPKEEALERMCKEKLAILELGDKMWSFKSDCPLYQIEEPLLHTYSAFPMQRRSPFTKVFNYMLTRYYAPGIHKRYERTTGLRPPPREIEGFEPVEMNQMVQVLFIPPCAAFIALILLLFEIFLKNLKHLKEFFKTRFSQKKNQEDIKLNYCCSIRRNKN